MADVTVTADDLMALRNEIRLAEQFNAQVLEPRLNEAIERYTGRHLPLIASDWSIILNEIYPVVQYNLPATFLRNPRVFLKPRSKYYFAKQRDPLTGEVHEVQRDSSASARTQEHILNYELEHIRYKQEVRKTLLDGLLFPHGVLWHGYKGDFGMTREKSFYIEKEQIYVMRISPIDFLWDPSVSIENLDQGMWVGRRFDVRLIDLLEDETLEVDKSRLKGVLGFGDKVTRKDIENVKGGQDTIQLGSSRLKALIDYASDEFKKSPRSKFVKLYEIFKRPTPKEEREKQKGKILLLSFEQPKPHRVSPWAYKAKGWPSKILQFSPVPDQRMGLMDIEVYGTIADHKNLVVNQQIRNAEQTNKVYIGISKEGADEEDVEKLRRGESTIVSFDTEDVKTRMFVASAGGSGSSELYLLDGRIDKNLQDKSGVSDLKRGFVQSGEESATSIRQRTAGGSARPAYRQDLMADFLKESCLYINDLIKQYKDIEDAVRIVGSLDIQWSENPSKEEIQADVDIELDITSMAPENPEQEVRELNTILTMMLQAIATPQVLAKIQQEGKTFNLSPIIEQLLIRLKIRNPDVFRKIRSEESQGYVEVAELRAAQTNIDAALRGQAPPSPPQEGQNHQARLEVYVVFAQLLQEMGHVSDKLNELIQVQSALLQAEQEKQGAESAPPKLPKPQVLSV